MKIVVMTGANDIDSKSPSDIVDDILLPSTAIHSQSPGASIHVAEVLPHGQNLHHGSKVRQQELENDNRRKINDETVNDKVDVTTNDHVAEDVICSQVGPFRYGDAVKVNRITYDESVKKKTTTDLVSNSVKKTKFYKPC
ncbi:hypothetical protein ACF0H5_013000 [Mactra antiquata]